MGSPKHSCNSKGYNYKINALTSSPFVSSQRPKTEFAAASTEHLEFNVVVIPA